MQTGTGVARASVVILAGVASARSPARSVACYSRHECEVTQELAKRFEAQNSDVKW